MKDVDTTAHTPEEAREGAPEATEVRPTTAAAVVRQQLQQLLAFGSLIVLIVFFSLASPNFLTWSNITNGVLLSSTVVGILALGTTFVIITAGIDLSLGTGMTLSAVMTAVFLANWGLPLVVGVIGGILTGAFIGFINGFNVAILRIPPFIATLAMMLIAQGLALVISGTAPIYFSDVEGFTAIATGRWLFGIPNAVLILFALTTIGAVLLNKSVLGRYTFALGSNEEAAGISGISVRKWKIIIYTLSGAFMGVAGLVIAARLNSAQPSLGVGYELQAIAAVVIGGTSLQGGKGSIVGTLIGALIVGTVTNGLRIMSIPQEWQTVILGLVILVAVYADSLRRRKEA